VLATVPLSQTLTMGLLRRARLSISLAPAMPYHRPASVTTPHFGQERARDETCHPEKVEDSLAAAIQAKLLLPIKMTRVTVNHSIYSSTTLTFRVAEPAVHFQ